MQFARTQRIHFGPSAINVAGATLPELSPAGLTVTRTASTRGFSRLDLEDFFIAVKGSRLIKIEVLHFSGQGIPAPPEQVSGVPFASASFS